MLAIALVHAAASYQRGIGIEARCYHQDKSCTISNPGHPGVPNSTLHTFDQTVDHFSFTTDQTFKQRYFTYDKFWKKGGPIFFYCGNEANVELYVNATGLMWENAEEFGALLLFAEHRYYGDSLPFGDKSSTPKTLQYLTMEQALADYATLMDAFKQAHGAENSAVVAFGGSYGGMLASWLRMKYPATVDGAIAASAPILAFANNHQPKPFGLGESFWAVVTRDATAAAGAPSQCASNIRKGWDFLFKLGETAAGRRKLSRTFRLCQALNTTEDVYNLALLHLNAWDTMAMGNFPYPSNYLIYQQTQNPSLLLPAFPVRAACSHLNGSYHASDGIDLLEAMTAAAGVFYNVTGVQCYNLPSDPDFDGIWDYQWCSEMLPQETYFSRDGVHDMFWAEPMNMTAINRHCRSTLGIAPRPKWIGTEFGGTRGATNIVFSNGLYDPWSSGGVLTDVGDTVKAVVIPEGAHHLDLMFANAQDPQSVRDARKTEMESVRLWIKQAAEKRAERRNVKSGEE